MDKSQQNKHEQEQAKPNTIQTSINSPIVGIGASAGGLEAVTALLKELSSNTGMAFVLVQHLAPTHESMLTELLSRETNKPLQKI